MRLGRWWLASGVAALVVGVSVAVAVLVVPRVARSYAVAEAGRRGLRLGVEGAQVGWLAVTLEGVDVGLVGVEGLEARFSTVRVDVDVRLHPTRVRARGGKVTVRNAASVRDDLEVWRASRGGAGEGAGRMAPVVDVEVEDLGVRAGGDERLSARNIHVLRDAEQTEMSVGSAEAASGQVALTVSDGHVTLAGPSMALRVARAGAAAVVWVVAAKTEVSSEPAASGAGDVPAVPDLPVVKKGKRRVAPTKELPAPVPQLLPDLHALRGELAALATAAAGRLPEGASVGVDALSVRLQKGDEDLTLGSGKFSIERDSRRIATSFSTSPLARATPLSLRAEVPTGAGDIELSASGGPVPLGLLGMHDGGLLHLLDVDRATFAGRGRVVLDDKGQSLTFDVEGAVRGLSMRDPRVALDAVRGLDLSLGVRGLVDDKGELRLDDADASIGTAHVTLHGGLAQTPDRLAAAFDFDFPTSSCQSLLTSVPVALVPTVSAARMDGTFSLRGHLAVDTRNLDAVSFGYDVSDHCRFVEVPPDLERGRFTHGFTHVIYAKTGEREEETTGPGTPSWTELDDISPYMQVAVLTTEDGAFFHHHGFNHAAIRNAVAADIKARRFVRGASTITMQLAKNLFLSREKTLARKLEELILADYLEQTFTKDEMMELYLNIIEFGPDVYGITAAADHYFGRRPNELDLAECMFLSSILPNPIGFHKVYDDGQLSEGWMRTIRARMEVAAQTGLISAAELAEGLKQTVAFYRAGDPRPAPRPAVSAPSQPASSADWKELN
jgi:hypothetical protein